MTTPDQILVDLLISQASADALAERMRIPMLAVRAMCERHEIDGLLEKFEIAETVTVWRLTESGREVAATLKPAAGSSAA